MMSHEFRTPLSTAIMFIDLLLKIIKNAEAIKLIELIRCSINLLLSLVNDIIDIKMIKSDNFCTKWTTFNPQEAIKFVLSMLGIQANSNKVELSFKAVPSWLLNNY